jgi:hypothetical protein
VVAAGLAEGGLARDLKKSADPSAFARFLPASGALISASGRVLKLREGGKVSRPGRETVQRVGNALVLAPYHAHHLVCDPLRA